jgi:DNA-binding transcriptional MerR regulator
VDGISIGSFALLTGLSVTRLRRYHEIGLLVPATVDPANGYRSYAPQQVDDGRRIARLRLADLPLDDIERLVAGGGEPMAILQRHRRRLDERVAAARRMIDEVDQLINEERARVTNTSIQLMEVILRVDDVEATVAFYRDVLGMDFQADDHNGALPLHYDACGGTWDPEGFFMFTIYPADGRPTKSHVGFGVPDVDAAWARAKAAGAKEISAPSDSGYHPRDAAFEDNAGNRVTMYQRAGDW